MSSSPLRDVRSTRSALALLTFLVLLATVLVPLPSAVADVRPSTVVVNSTADRPLDPTGTGCDTGEEVDGQPECTLRAAVELAEADDDLERIELPAGTYVLDDATAGNLQVTSELDVVGTAERDQVVVVRGGNFRLFEVAGDAAALRLVSLTLDGDDRYLGSVGGSAVSTRDDADLELTDVTLVAHRASGHGGALALDGARATVRDSAFVANRSELNTGGAVSLAGGDLTVVGSHFEDNDATMGGALRLGPGSDAAVSVTGTTFVANHARFGGAVAVANGTDATITNSTFSANSATPLETQGAGGGAVLVQTDAALTLDSVTIADHVVDGDAPEPPAAVFATNRGEVTVTNSILAEDRVDACGVAFDGSIVSEDHNLTHDDTCGFAATSDRVGDADLGPLADHGGPTLTHALGADSPAIDAGATALAVDQRGVARPQGDASDIGAFELVPADPVVACPDDVPAAGFGDVPADSLHRAAIDCLAWRGITRGVSAERYAPRAPVTRGQAATFLAGTLAEAGVALPDVRRSSFDDVGGVHEPAIAQLTELGIIVGVDADRFAPNAPVTRAQKASLLVRTVETVTGTTLPAPAGPFTDTAGSVHARAIDAAAAAGIARGRTATSFDPQTPTRRDQMASLLVPVLDRLLATR